MKHRNSLILLGLLALPIGLAAQTPADRAAAEIDRDAIEGPIRFLADDLLEGRGPASRGDELAQLYLARRAADAGLRARRRQGQLAAAVRHRRHRRQASPKTWSFAARAARTSTSSAPTTTSPRAACRATRSGIENAELVFVGYGIQAPEYQWDDFKGMDLKGKVLVMLNNDPDWDPKLFAGNRRLYYGRWTYKYESAARQGAAGRRSSSTPRRRRATRWQVVQTSWTGEQFELPAEDEPRIQLQGWATEDAARQLVKAGAVRIWTS